MHTGLRELRERGGEGRGEREGENKRGKKRRERERGGERKIKLILPYTLHFAGVQLVSAITGLQLTKK